MKYLRTLFIVVMMGLVITSQQAKANVFAHNIRITQEGGQGPFDGRFSDGTGISIRFVLSDHADSVVAVVKEGVTTIRTFTTTNLNVGDTSVVWDGKDDGGNYVSFGTHAYTLSLTAYDGGHGTYTEVSYNGPSIGISSRGVTTINNPALKNFGFIYDADNNPGTAAGAVGVGRFSADGTPWGDVKGKAQLTTTGIAIGTSEARWGSTADSAGYVYVCGRTAKKLYRYHTDSLNIIAVDSGYGSFYPFDLAVMNDAGGETFAVVANTNSTTATLTGDSRIFSFHIDHASDTYFGAKDTLIKKATGDSVMYWDAAWGRDSVLYATFIYAGGHPHSGVAKFDLKGKTFPLTLADTVWTVRSDSGYVSALSMYYGSATNGSNDILYFVNARIASGNPPSGQGIWAITGLNTATPAKVLAYADRQNNASITHSDISVDAAGNVVYLENSDEETAVISPPTGSNNFTTPGSFSLKVVNSISISQARIDANNDFIPDSLGKTVTVVGTVNSVNFQGTANFQYMIQDDSAGIEMFQYGSGPVLHMGDRVVVTGLIAQYRGTTEIEPANPNTDVILLDSNNVLTPIPLTISQLLSNGEKYESRLVKISGIAKMSTSPAWPATGSDANMKFWDGWDSLLVRIDKDAPNLSGTTEPTYPVNVTGVVTQFTSSASVYNDGYQLSPNDSTDFVSSGNVTPNPHYALLTPTNGSTIVLDSAAQSVTFSWKKAVDLNGDALIYQWNPIGGSAVLSAGSGADTFVVRTGAQLAAFLGTHDTVTLKWTSKVKDASPTIVSNVDTSSVILVRGTITGVALSDLLPKEYALSQNFPNPFNPTTTIRFALPNDAKVSLKVYDMLGREVRTLIDGNLHVGYQEVMWDGRNNAGIQVASGMYIYRITAGSFVSSKKMLLLK
jgi:flagellar hook assembly protein FlgD